MTITWTKLHEHDGLEARRQREYAELVGEHVARAEDVVCPRLSRPRPVRPASP